MNTPQRITLSRKKGWRIPPNTVNVDRSTKWGNPYRIGDGLCHNIDDVIRYYEEYLKHGTNYVSDQIAPSQEEIKVELSGKNLACSCKQGEKCHADVLLRIASG